jgi:hypothetical protein
LTVGDGVLSPINDPPPPPPPRPIPPRRPPGAHNRRRRQADNVNLGAIWANEFAAQGDDGNPQF